MLSVLLLLPTAFAQTPATGDLFVTADSAGARVLVDGVDSGKVSPVMLRGLPAGPHGVSVRTPCSSADTTVTVTPGAIARAELTLQVRPGGLRVDATPPGAAVRLDGVVVGAAPFSSGTLSCGEHLVVVEAPDFVPNTRRIVVVAGETIAIDAALTPQRFGSLVLDVTPLDARVRLDGADLGAGPRTVDRVPAGAHQVDASAPGFARLSVPVELAADETRRVDLHLAPGTVSRMRSLPAGRIAADAGVTAAGLGAGIAAGVAYGGAREAYARFLETPSNTEADRIFDEEVAPRQTLAAVLAGAGVVALATAGFLWVTTDFTPDGTTIGVSGTF